MKARVPYFARLARQAAGQPLLRPPRQLFTGDTGLAVPSPDEPGSGWRRHGDEATPSLPGSRPLSGGDEQPPAPGATEPPPARGPRREPMAGQRRRSVTPAEPVPAVTSVSFPATPGVAAVAGSPAGTVTGPGRPDWPRPPRLGPYRPGPAGPAGPADPELPGAADGGRVNAPGARPVTPPTEPVPSGSRRRPDDTGPGQPPPGAWESLWDGPVELPVTAGPAPVVGRAEPRALPVARAVPAAGARGGPGAEHAAEADRSSEPTAARGPVPPPAADAAPAALPVAEPGEPRRRPRAAQRPRVSIGTIDITVVPPATPEPAAAAAREIAPAAQGTPRWSRPSYPLAASAGADRLRDGFRRWYGTAQG